MLTFFEQKTLLPLSRRNMYYMHYTYITKRTQRVDAHRQRAADLQPDTSEEDFDRTAAAQSYPNLEEAPTFISRNRQGAGPHTFTTSVNSNNLQGHQLEVYTIVKDHFETAAPLTLWMIIAGGTASTGKSYLIYCITLLPGNTVKVSSPSSSGRGLVSSIFSKHSRPQDPLLCGRKRGGIC